MVAYNVSTPRFHVSIPHDEHVRLAWALRAALGSHELWTKENLFEPHTFDVFHRRAGWVAQLRTHPNGYSVLDHQGNHTDHLTYTSAVVALVDAANSRTPWREVL